MLLSPALISLLPGGGWGGSQDGFTVQALFFKDATFNKTLSLLCVLWLWEKNGKEIPVFLRASVTEDPGSDTQNNLEQFPAIHKCRSIFKI